MNKRRLLKLANLLEADAKNKKGVKFDLGRWGRAIDDDYASVSCGTTACAVGLAILSGAFKRAGLKNVHGEMSFSICPGMPSGASGFDAVDELFGLEGSQSGFLFHESSYPDSKTKGAVGERYVAKRIRDFVAGKAKAVSDDR